jgi:hypothetical protein
MFVHGMRHKWNDDAIKKLVGRSCGYKSSARKPARNERVIVNEVPFGRPEEKIVISKDR